MSSAEYRALISLPVILLLGAAITWAGSQGGERMLGWPVFAWCAGLSFGLNWLAFVHAWIARTERYFDLTGSLTYLSVVVLALAARGTADPRALLIGALVAVWAVRLGSFLFLRISRAGSDSRFDELKHSFPRFLMVWTLQGLWVLLTLACALAAMLSAATRPGGLFTVVGVALWVAGFAIEAVADYQKTRFRERESNRGQFIAVGLWAWSRHPNYFGEITLWVGIAVIAFPALAGWQLITLISPVFVYLLLTRVSGIPLLEARAEEKWGDDPAYQTYKARTPVLLPWPPSKG